MSHIFKYSYNNTKFNKDIKLNESKEKYILKKEDKLIMRFSNKYKRSSIYFNRIF
jgi:hypothetical protein